MRAVFFAAVCFAALFRAGALFAALFRARPFLAAAFRAGARFRARAAGRRGSSNTAMASISISAPSRRIPLMITPVAAEKPFFMNSRRTAAVSRYRSVVVMNSVVFTTSSKLLPAALRI